MERFAYLDSTLRRRVARLPVGRLRDRSSRMIPLPVDAATTADDAADYLVQMHREGCIDLHAHPALTAFVREFFGGFERDGMDVADDQYAADKDES